MKRRSTSARMIASSSWPDRRLTLHLVGRVVAGPRLDPGATPATDVAARAALRDTPSSSCWTTAAHRASPSSKASGVFHCAAFSPRPSRTRRRSEYGRDTTGSPSTLSTSNAMKVGVRGERQVTGHNRTTRQQPVNPSTLVRRAGPTATSVNSLAALRMPRRQVVSWPCSCRGRCNCRRRDLLDEVAVHLSGRGDLDGDKGWHFCPFGGRHSGVLLQSSDYWLAQDYGDGEGVLHCHFVRASRSLCPRSRV
jgi:hypothetical protein